MTNSIRGPVRITLDRERTLLLDGNAMVEVEDILGEEFDLAKIFEGGAKKLRALLYVGLKKDDPELTLEKAGELYFPTDVGKIMDAILNGVWGGYIPDEIKQKAEERAKNAQRTVIDGESVNSSAPPSAVA